MKLENGTLTISATYSLKAPAAADFSSQEARLGIDVAFPVAGEYDAIIDNADAMESSLMTQLKLAVFSQLGLGVTEDESGTIQPDFGTLPARTTAAAPAAASGGGYSGGANGAQAQRGPSKAQQAGIDIPKYSLNVDGVVQQVQDFRPLKNAGVYKPTAADFRVGQDSLWLVDKKGNVNAKASAIAEQIQAMAAFVPQGVPAGI